MANYWEKVVVMAAIVIEVKANWDRIGQVVTIVALCYAAFAAIHSYFFGQFSQQLSDMITILSATPTTRTTTRTRRSKATAPNTAAAAATPTATPTAAAGVTTTPTRAAAASTAAAAETPATTTDVSWTASEGEWRALAESWTAIANKWKAISGAWEVAYESLRALAANELNGWRASVVSSPAIGGCKATRQQLESHSSNVRAELAPTR